MCNRCYFIVFERFKGILTEMGVFGFLPKRFFVHFCSKTLKLRLLHMNCHHCIPLRVINKKFIFSIISKSSKADIRIEDLWKLEPTEECEFLANRLETIWTPLAEKYAQMF